MSVKSKVKRCNKRIAELEKELEELKSKNITLEHLRIDRNEEMIKECKDNFIKVMLNERKPLEHNCCRFTISKRQLDTMKIAKLKVEKSIGSYDGIDFTLKI